MLTDARNTKAFLKVAGEWQEIKFISGFGIDTPSQETKESLKELAGSLNGWTEIQFKDVAALATELRKKPKLEAWKANGKRKKPRIK